MFKFYLIYILIFPYILFLNILSFGNDSLGIGSIFFSIYTFLLILILIFSLDRIHLNKKIFIGLCFFSIVIIFKFIFHIDGKVLPAHFTGYFGNSIFFILSYLFSKIFFSNYNDKENVIRLISNSYIISSLIGIIHFYFFYQIPFLDPEFGNEGTGVVFNVENYDLMRFRETSIFFGPNVNAYMSVFGFLFLFFSFNKGLVEIVKMKKFWLGFIIHVWNIIVSDSRSGLIVLLILFFLFINDGKIGLKTKNSFLIKGIFYFFGCVSFVLIAIYHPRFSFDIIMQDERIIKISIGIIIFTEKIINVLIGAPINHNWAIGDISVSDNLYVALLLYVGIIGSIIIFVTFRIILKKINLFINNSENFNNTSLISKYFIYSFILIGCFSIPVAMLPVMVLFGFVLGSNNYI
jgi:hypothetical protein